MESIRILEPQSDEPFVLTGSGVSERVPKLFAMMKHGGHGVVSARGKLTPERYLGIVNYVRSGVPLKYAAAAVGVSENTIFSWAERGEKEPESIYGMFVEDVSEAQGQGIAANILNIRRASVDDWKASVYLNKIIDREMFGEKSIVENRMTGDKDNPVVVEHVISNDELAKMLQITEAVEAQNEIIDAEFKLVETNDEDGDEDDDDSPVDFPVDDIHPSETEE